MTARPSSPAVLSALALLAGGMGCAPVVTGAEFLDAPVDVTVLEGGPFESPVGFVSNARSGRITPLDVKRGTYLSDSLAAPFLPPRGIATGDQRELGSVAAFSPSGSDVVVYAIDLTHQVLIEAPYILGVDADITVAEPTLTDPVFNDTDGSGDDARFTELEVRTGATTTEDWTVSSDGEAWWVTGTRSGRQSRPAYNDIRYTTDNHELEFVITGSATVGDVFTFSTDTGLVEHDLGGAVLDLLHLPGQPFLACAVWDTAADQGWISLFDMAVGAERGRVSLPTGAQAWRLDLDTAGNLYVADAHQSAAYIIDLDVDTPESSPILTLPTAGPLVDVAWVGGTDYSHLFAAIAGQNRVDVYDLDAGAWRDVNPYDDRIGGIDLRSPVIGMDASPAAVDLQELVEWSNTADDLIPREDHVVALSTLDGALLMLEGQTGCLVRSISGPYTTNETLTSEYDYTGVGTTSFFPSPATEVAIQAPRCGGMLLEESWTLRYDGAEGNWVLEGTRSGEQQSRAVLDQRYLSDDGALSFTLLSGTIPPADGDTFSFDSVDGVLRLISYTPSSSSSAIPLKFPGEPEVFQYTSGQEGGGWDVLQRHSYALVPITGANLVFRVRLDTWAIEVIWD